MSCRSDGLGSGISSPVNISKLLRSEAVLDEEVVDLGVGEGMGELQVQPVTCLGDCEFQLARDRHFHFRKPTNHGPVGARVGK